MWCPFSKVFISSIGKPKQISNPTSGTQKPNMTWNSQGGWIRTLTQVEIPANSALTFHYHCCPSGTDGCFNYLLFIPLVREGFTTLEFWGTPNTHLTLERWVWQQFVHHLYWQPGRGGHHIQGRSSLGNRMNNQELLGTDLLVVSRGWGAPGSHGRRFSTSLNFEGSEGTETQ